MVSRLLGLLGWLPCWQMHALLSLLHRLVLRLWKAALQLLQELGKVLGRSVATSDRNMADLQR